MRKSLHPKKPKTTITGSEHGQLIVLMGVYLAVSVFIIASIPSEISDINTIVSSQRATSVLNEYNHLTEVYGLALQYSMCTSIQKPIDEDGVIYYGNLTGPSFQTSAFNRINNEFFRLLLRYDIIFSCTRATSSSYTFEYISDKGHVGYFPFITIGYDDGSTTLSKNFKYSVICKQWGG